MFIFIAPETHKFWLHTLKRPENSVCVDTTY